ncbi:Cullin [Polychytrium aggregatum]|uniref:Cullin n=1 Tax=Polychytrium aggregatum TaxID=110093 RepID=UPI0022FF0A49|nr:Cullin [Polychytrium aggregatum]KAI9202603.1 Cullin [Polychytrium aggregatum]
MSTPRGHRPKTVIRAVKRSRHDYNELWPKIANAIMEIYRQNAGMLSFEELYRTAYNLVISKNGTQLYNDVRKAISNHLDNVVQVELVPSLSSTSDSTGGKPFLNDLDRSWETHIVQSGMIGDILLYLDTQHLKPLGETLIYDMALNLYRDVVIHSSLHKPLIKLLLDLIHRERNGESVDRLMLKSTLRMLTGLTSGPNSRYTIYDTDFEPRFLEESQAFYETESEVFLRECDAVQYLIKVEKRLQDEEQRVTGYMNRETEPKIRAILEDKLIKTNMKTLIYMENSGLVKMLENGHVDDLQRMYSLLGRTEDGHTEMKAVISGYIESCGVSINEPWVQSQELRGPGKGEAINTPAAAIQWVEAIIEAKTKMYRILDHAFSSDKSFRADIDAALAVVVNQNSKCPECVCLFIDDNLRKGIKGKSDTEIDILLDKAIEVFRFIQEKDIFERYFKQHLAKRLLLGTSVSEDAEKSILSKLKIECGVQFTNKLEGMFNDMRVSDEITADFDDRVSNQHSGTPGLSIKVLTATYWPVTSNLQAVHYPQELVSNMIQFEKYYFSRHSGRKLTWLPHLGDCDIRAYFEKGTRLLNVSTLAAITLLSLANAPEGSQEVEYSDIQTQTGISDSELKRTLQSLSLGKYKILLKSTKGRDIAPTDRFQINTEFSSPLQKIKIKTISSSTSDGALASKSGNQLESSKERAETMEKIEEERRHIVEAAVVRIMKSRKQLDHTNLCSEVLSQLKSKFQPNPTIVKKRIEGLIEREYLRRDEVNRNIYHYIA